MGKSINKSILSTTGLISITACTGLVLAGSTVSADDVVDNVSITIPVSCTMSGSGMNTHSAEVPNGTYQANIGTTTINALCNDNAGFSIYAAGYTGEEIGGTNSNKLVGTSASGNAVIDTGTATGPAGNSDNSNWAMKLAPVTTPTPTYPITITSDTEGTFSNYHTVPNEYTKVATRLQGTDVGTNAEGSSLTTTYAAYISKNQPADTYSGKVKYTLVHPNDHAAPTPPAETACTTPVPNLTYMQDLNSSNKASILTGMQEDKQYFLKDKRDEKSYCVAKLKDGNIWMTQNLDHDIKTDGSVTYDSTTTDIASAWAPSTATHPSSTTTWNGSETTPESYDPGDQYVSQDAINGWKYYYSCTSGSCDAATYVELNSDWKAYFDSCDAGTVNNCDDSLKPTNNTAQDGIQHYHLGNYYNWTAAVAMNDSSSYTTQYQDVDQSICPAGWTLPKAGNNTSNGSFRYLAGLYNYTPDSEGAGYSRGHMTNPYPYNDPLYLNLAGYWHGSFSVVGGLGDFWSPVVYHSVIAYLFGAGANGGVDASYDGFRDDGLSVRCLSR